MNLANELLRETCAFTLFSLAPGATIDPTLSGNQQLHAQLEHDSNSIFLLFQHLLRAENPASPMSLQAIEQVRRLSGQLASDIQTTARVFEEHDPFARACVWLSDMISMGVDTLYNSAVHWQNFQQFVSNSSTKADGAHKLHAFAQDLGAKAADLWEASHTNEPSSAIRACAVSLVNLHQQVESLKLVVGAGTGSQALESTRTYLLRFAAVCCTFSIVQQSINNELSPVLQHIAQLAQISVPSDEADLIEEMQQIKLMLPCYTTACTRLVTHTCFQYVSNPFYLVESIAVNCNQIANQFLKPSFVANHLFANLKNFKNGLIDSRDLSSHEATQFIHLLRTFKNLVGLNLNDSTSFCNTISTTDILVALDSHSKELAATLMLNRKHIGPVVAKLHEFALATLKEFLQAGMLHFDRFSAQCILFPPFFLLFLFFDSLNISRVWTHHPCI